MTIPIGRSIPLLFSAVILGACSQSPQRAWDGIGAVLSGDMQNQVQEDHQRLAKAIDRIDASEQDRAQLRRDLEQIRGQLTVLEEIRGRLTELTRPAETVEPPPSKYRPHNIPSPRHSSSPPADHTFKELREEVGRVANASPPPVR